MYYDGVYPPLNPLQAKSRRSLHGGRMEILRLHALLDAQLGMADWVCDMIHDKILHGGVSFGEV